MLVAGLITKGYLKKSILFIYVDSIIPLTSFQINYYVSVVWPATAFVLFDRNSIGLLGNLAFNIAEYNRRKKGTKNRDKMKKKMWIQSISLPAMAMDKQGVGV